MRSLTTALFLVAGPVFAQDADPQSGDAAAGEALWAQCRGCHQVGADAESRIGPHLNGVFDRPAAELEDFRYSQPFQRAAANGLVWSYDTLDAFLENPRQLVTGTRMAYPGLRDATDRADLLAYLRQFSDDPANIPEASPTSAAVDHEVAPEVLAIVGDPAYGEYLSSECTACHQASGAATGIPSIVAWPQEDFVIAMHAYKEGVRQHNVMQMMAGRLSNEEIAALAAYFGSLE